MEQPTRSAPPLRLPLPTRLPCRLTIKSGKPLERCRDKDTPTALECEIAEGYDVLRAKVRSVFVAKGLVWSDTMDVYLKPSKQAAQRLFIKLDAGSFQPAIEGAWKVARLRRSGQQDFELEIFVYIPREKKKAVTTLHRASKERVETVTPRVRETLEAAGIPYGSATLRYAATAQARLPDSHPVQVPNSTTFRQLQRTDRLESEAAEQPRRPDDFVEVEVKINGTKTMLPMNIHHLRRALGLPAYALCPPYRAPPLQVELPEEDIEDVDHAPSDDDQDDILVD